VSQNLGVSNQEGALIQPGEEVFIPTGSSIADCQHSRPTLRVSKATIENLL